MTILFGISIYLIFLVIFSFWRGKELSSKSTSLLKCFFPNWRFFEFLRPIPILYVRYGRTEASLSDWQRVVPQRTRDLESFIVNPMGNYQLALNTMVENFSALAMSEITPQLLVQSTDYTIVEAMSLEFLKLNSPESLIFQFKVQIESYGIKNEDLLMSQIIGVKAQ